VIPDVHCHLGDLEDPHGALAGARRSGVGPVLAVSMGCEGASVALRLRDASRPGEVLAGAGIHPSRVPELDDEALRDECSRLESLAARADFIGEIGLDFRDAAGEPQRNRQRALLDRLLSLAANLRLPVNMHTRRADRELVECAERFRRENGLGVIMHWFTHSRSLARRCGASEIHISAGPSILTDDRQAGVARSIDPRFLLVETDSPVVYAGRKACPAWARRVAIRLASLHGTSLERMASQLEANLESWRFAGRRPGA